MRSDLSLIDNEHFDIAVIGGGINGASTAQHAVAAGYSVIVVDKADFGSGATSRSSRLLHCGLRYFEVSDPILHFLRHPGQLITATRMARQAMQARRELVKDSKSRTRAMTFLFPIFAGGPYKTWQVNLAFKLLGNLAQKDVPLNYNFLSPNEALQNPLISSLAQRDHLVSIASFDEYRLDWPERLCMDAVLDAERMGAVIRNYTRANLRSNENGVWEINLVDELIPNKTANVYAKVVLNMAGVWIDKITKAAEARAPRKVFGTKGAHIVVKLPPECKDFGITTTNINEEPFYCVPWHGLHYIGPTETPFDGDFDNVFTDQSDVDFLLKQTQAILPGLNIDGTDIVSTWAGVRPLTYDPAFPKGKRSRELHDLSSIGLDHVFAMTAGPVMTHRSAGREITKKLKSILKPSGSTQQPSFETQPLFENTNTAPLLKDDPTIRLEHLKKCVTEQHAQTLSDVLYRRTGLGWRHSLTDPEIELAAQAISSSLGWSEIERAKNIELFKAEVDRLFGHPKSAVR